MHTIPLGDGEDGACRIFPGLIVPRKGINQGRKGSRKGNNSVTICGYVYIRQERALTEM